MPRNYEQKTVKSYTDRTLQRVLKLLKMGRCPFVKLQSIFKYVLLHFSCILQIVSAISRGAGGQHLTIQLSPFIL